jgi:molecular chaperone GrpE
MEKELEKDLNCECEDCTCEDGKCECDDCNCGDEKCDCTCEDDKCECDCEHEHVHDENCEHEHVHDENCNHEHHDPRYEYILALEKDLKEAEDKVLRTKADLINYRKRMEEEQIRMFKYMNEDVLKSMLPIIDNFERAILLDDENLSDELSKFLTGFKMVYADLSNILKNNEVKVIEALDKEFDPNFHEAVLTEKVEGKPSGIVIDVMQKGYMFKDKVLRPAMVKVSE